MASQEVLRREAARLLRGDPCCEALLWAAAEIERLRAARDLWRKRAMFGWEDINSSFDVTYY